MKRIVLLSLLFVYSFSHTQTFFERDTLPNKKRLGWASGLVAAGWTGSMIGLQQAWYQENWTDFHLFDDSREWLGMDKIGHGFTGYAITKNISSIYHWGGLNRGASLAIGSGVALGYLTTLEILDGFSKNWGFSWSDMAANSIGIAWYAWQDLLWKEERLKLKFSTHLSPYAQYRPNTLGSNFAERLLKDYNGQTYWLTISPGQFLSSSSTFPKWIGISVGYSIDQKLHGDQNTYQVIDADGKTINFYARSQVLLSLDIDFEKIPTQKKWLKTIFRAINHLKVPFPALIFSDNQVKGHPFYF